MKYILFNKPYGTTSQFTKEGDSKTLQAFSLPKEVYPAGRLDKDSEGLLFLTNDGPLIERLLEPRHKKSKTYIVQVEGSLSRNDLTPLLEGVTINLGKGKKYKTLPAECKIIQEPTWLWQREPPVRYRKTIPTSWLQIKITEGKNRQVRKMTAQIGFPTLRLIRTSIGPLELGNLALGEWKEISKPKI